MPSMAKFFGGGRTAPNMVREDQLGALVRQLRDHGEHRGQKVISSPEKAKGAFRIEQGRSRRGDWRVRGSLMGRVESTDPVRWTCATNGGAWCHATAGWWPTEADAHQALTEAIQFAFADVFRERDELAERNAAGAALRAPFVERLQALNARHRAAGGWYDISFTLTGFSVGGGDERPLTVEGVDAFEAEIVAAEMRRDEKTAFRAAAPPLVERLVEFGIRAELVHDGVRTVVEGMWKTTFPDTNAGLAMLQARILEEEHRQSAPIDVGALDLSKLFGGAGKK